MLNTNTTGGNNGNSGSSGASDALNGSSLGNGNDNPGGSIGSNSGVGKPSLIRNGSRDFLASATKTSARTEERSDKVELNQLFSGFGGENAPPSVLSRSGAGAGVADIGKDHSNNNNSKIDKKQLLATKPKIHTMRDDDAYKRLFDYSSRAKGKAGEMTEVVRQVRCRCHIYSILS